MLFIPIKTSMTQNKYSQIAAHLGHVSVVFYQISIKTLLVATIIGVGEKISPDDFYVDRFRGIHIHLLSVTTTTRLYK
jgi:hypothetical protein